MEPGPDGGPLVWLFLALAFLPVLAAWAAIESWDLAGQLGRFYSLSNQLPLARFLPPTVQVLVPVWLGTPEASKGQVAAAIHLPRPIGGWPIEAPILLLVLVLAVLYEFAEKPSESLCFSHQRELVGLIWAFQRLRPPDWTDFGALGLS